MDTNSPNPFAPKQSELGQLTTVAEVERDHLVQTTVVPQPVPFGYLHNEWLLFKQQLQEDDKLQYLRGDFGDGLALIRDGQIVNWIGCGIPKHKRG